MDPQMQLIKDYFTGGGVRGQVDGNRIVLDNIVLGEFDIASRQIKISQQSQDGNYSKAFMLYTILQLTGMSIYRRLRDSAKVRFQQASGTSDEERVRAVFADAYADYAVYGGEFGFVTNQETTSFMQDLFDEEKLEGLLD